MTDLNSTCTATSWIERLITSGDWANGFDEGQVFLPLRGLQCDAIVELFFKYVLVFGLVGLWVAVSRRTHQYIIAACKYVSIDFELAHRPSNRTCSGISPSR